MKKQGGVRRDAHPRAATLFALKDQTAAFKGALIMEQLRNRGIDRNGALNVIEEFLDREVLYSPHSTEG